jgi:secreted trypsin-like serine protease
MKLLIFCSLALFFIDSALAGSRILNGYPIDVEQAPYIAHVVIEGLGSCTGSIVSENYILTAGHCELIEEIG